MQNENLSNYFSKDFICLWLHAMAELMTMFFSGNITLEECCKELNIDNFKHLLSLTQLIILINNFSEQKDENFDLTKNDYYIKDKLDAFEFKFVKVIEGSKTPKRIIKEIRDAFEHKSYYINNNGMISIDNKRTGFKADLHNNFLIGSFFYYYNANNMNHYFLDDSKINYNEPIEKIIDELKIYRVIAKQKKDVRNMDAIARYDLDTLTKYFTFNSDYNYVKVKLNEEEKQSILNYFKTRSVNKENLYVILSIVKTSGPVLYNNINQFVFTNFLKLDGKSTRRVVKKYLNELDDSNIVNQRNNNILRTLFSDSKFCQNYFKLLFIKYVICNMDYEMSEEDIHIRNCLTHIKYSWLNHNEILMQDHPNGINNEAKITFAKKYNIDELYEKSKELFFTEPILQIKK